MRADRLAALIGDHLPGMMQGRYSPNHCLSSTRITLEVARAVGVPARAMAVECIVANARWLEILEDEGWPDDQSKFADWIKRGAWSVGALPGYEIPGQEGDTGHVVAILGRNWLSDCALAQFRRAKHGMVVPDAISMQLPSGFEKGREFALTSPGDYAIGYRAHPQYRDYARASGWIEPPVRDRHIINELVSKSRRRERVT